jgi:hypothetical protein
VCTYLGCWHGMRYTCFSGGEHFVGRPRSHPKSSSSTVVV